jgi:hypothetical protein
MRSFFQKKLWIILLATLALGALTVLALSLDEVPFNEGQRFSPRETLELPPVSSEDVTDAWANVPLWKQIVLWGLVSLMVLLVALLLSPELRKRFFRLLFRMAVTALGIYYLLKLYGDQILGLQAFGRNAAQLGDPVNAQPMPTFQPPQISPAFSYLLSFAFALLWIALMWGLYQGWKKYMRLNTPKPLDEIARIARSSLHDLSSGRDSSDVIINCYLRMSDVVANKRQLQREIAMTPQEFALRLERAGLPGDAVRRLTRLFEMVRYGDRKSAPKDVSEAVSCLNTILHYCGETI